MSLDLAKLDLKALVRTIPDYPKKGILFRDITTLIEHPEGFKESVERIANAHRGMGVTHVAGIEARGFIFGAGVAIALGVGFIPIRKKGKLPGETIGQNYALEYGVDTIEIHADVLDAGDKRAAGRRSDRHRRHGDRGGGPVAPDRGDGRPFGLRHRPARSGRGGQAAGRGRGSRRR